MTISKQKCFISNTGALEFAKRFFVDRVQTDFSPVSLRSLQMVHSTIGLLAIREKYNINNGFLGGKTYTCIGGKMSVQVPRIHLDPGDFMNGNEPQNNMNYGQV